MFPYLETTTLTKFTSYSIIEMLIEIDFTGPLYLVSKECQISRKRSYTDGIDCEIGVCFLNNFIIASVSSYSITAKGIKQFNFILSTNMDCVMRSFSFKVK